MYAQNTTLEFTYTLNLHHIKSAGIITRIFIIVSNRISTFISNTNFWQKYTLIPFIENLQWMYVSRTRVKNMSHTHIHTKNTIFNVVKPNYLWSWDDNHSIMYTEIRYKLKSIYLINLGDPPVFLFLSHCFTSLHTP